LVEKFPTVLEKLLQVVRGDFLTHTVHIQTGPMKHLLLVNSSSSLVGVVVVVVVWLYGKPTISISSILSNHYEPVSVGG